MRTFQDYMETPEIADEPLFLREIHAARLMLQDETRDMTPEERAAYFNQKSAELLHFLKPRQPVTQ
jgi:hypothetical protein